VEYIALLLLHYLSDFLLQSRIVAENKSINKSFLIVHCSIIFLALSIFTLNPLFGIINAVIHGFIDKNIWSYYRKNAKSKRYWKDNSFYSTLGLDQLLHVSVLFITWDILK